MVKPAAKRMGLAVFFAAPNAGGVTPEQLDTLLPASTQIQVVDPKTGLPATVARTAVLDGWLPVEALLRAALSFRGKPPALDGMTVVAKKRLVTWDTEVQLVLTATHADGRVLKRGFALSLLVRNQPGAPDITICGEHDF